METIWNTPVDTLLTPNVRGDVYFDADRGYLVSSYFGLSRADFDRLPGDEYRYAKAPLREAVWVKTVSATEFEFKVACKFFTTEAPVS